MATYELPSALHPLPGTSAVRRARNAVWGVLTLVDAALELAFTTSLTWHRRLKDRIALQSLDDHMLRDIGLSRADIEREATKPFWKA
jgi:uncharacterized protein YjiS (DUF1127 family)